MVYSAPYLFGISTMELPTSKFTNYAYTWHRLSKPPEKTFTSSTIQWLLFLFHLFPKHIFPKQISPNTYSSTIPIGTEGSILVTRNIDRNKFLNNEYDISLPLRNFPTPISVQLTTTPPTTPAPRKKLEMTPDEEQSFISNLLNDPSTFPQEDPIKETIGKLGLMWTRNYTLAPPATPLSLTTPNMGAQLISENIVPSSKLS